jgi:hypothetical protein
MEYHATLQGLKTTDAMRGNFKRYLGALPVVPRILKGRERIKSAVSVDWQRKKLLTIRAADVLHLRTALAKQSGEAAANHAVKLSRTVFAQLG